MAKDGAATPITTDTTVTLITISDEQTPVIAVDTKPEVGVTKKQPTVVTMDTVSTVGVTETRSAVVAMGTRPAVIVPVVQPSVQPRATSTYSSPTMLPSDAHRATHFKWEVDQSITESLLGLSDMETEEWYMLAESPSILAEDPDILEPWSWTVVENKAIARVKEQSRAKKRGSTLLPQGGESSTQSMCDIKVSPNRLDYNRRQYIVNCDSAQLLHTCTEPQTYRYIPNNGTYRAFKMTSRLDQANQKIPRRAMHSDNRMPLNFEQRKLQREIQQQLRKELETDVKKVDSNANVLEDEVKQEELAPKSHSSSEKLRKEEQEYFAKPQTFELPPINVPLLTGQAGHMQSVFTSPGKEPGLDLTLNLRPERNDEETSVKASKVGHKRRSRSEPPPVSPEEESAYIKTGSGDDRLRGLQAEGINMVHHRQLVPATAWDEKRLAQKSQTDGDSKHSKDGQQMVSDSMNAMSQLALGPGCKKTGLNESNSISLRNKDPTSSLPQMTPAENLLKSNTESVKSCDSAPTLQDLASIALSSSDFLEKTVSAKLDAQILHNPTGIFKVNRKGPFAKKTKNDLTSKKLRKDLASADLSLRSSSNVLVGELNKSIANKQQSGSTAKAKGKKELAIQEPEMILPVISGTKIYHKVK